MGGSLAGCGSLSLSINLTAVYLRHQRLNRHITCECTEIDNPNEGPGREGIRSGIPWEKMILVDSRSKT